MVKNKKILRGTPLHLSKSGKLNDFAYLMINLPFLCNYKCKKCFNLNNNLPDIPETAISTDKIFKLIEEAKKMGGKVVVIAGEGEPTLDKNIEKIVEKINSLNMLSIVYSNASLLTKDIINFYATHNTTLVISFDALSPKLYTKLIGINNTDIFKQVLKNIELARTTYKNFIKEKNDHKIVRLAINATVNSLNKEEVGKIKKFCNDDIYFICNPLAKLGNATSNWSDLIKSENDYKEIQKLVEEMSETTGPLTLDNNGLCGYSINGIAVNPRGDYITCAYTSLTNGLLGTVFNKSLSEAYGYKKTQEQTFYKTYGTCPCLVRSSKFNGYLKTLKNNINVL